MGGAGLIKLVADPYPPYQYWEGNEVKGVDHDLIVIALRGLGYGVEVELLPWEECLRRVEEGDAHGIFQITKTPERERKFVFPGEPLRVANTVLVVNPGATVRITPGTELGAQLRPYKVGVLSGYSYGPLLDDLPSPIKVPVGSQEELFLRLLKGELYLAAMDLGVARYLARKHGLSGLKTVEGLQVDRELFVAFKADVDPGFVESFNAQLHALKEQGEFEKIKARYGI